MSKKKKKKLKKQDCNPVPKEYLWKELEDPKFAEYKSGKIIYSKEFYNAMFKLIESGMTYVDAYKSLGFNIDKTGTDRANSAGKRAVQMAKEGKLNTPNRKAYYGGTPSAEMDHLDPEEKLAYLEARVLYLENIEQAKKNVMQRLLEKQSNSK